MSTLLLNSAAGHASRAFVAQKTAHPDHHQAETETFHQQAIDVFKKIVSILLTICSLSGPGKQTNERLPYIIDHQKHAGAR